MREICRHLFAACALLLPEVALSTPLITVDSFRWTDSVDIGKKQFNKVHGNPAKVTQIYIWMSVKGSKELLEQLRRSATGTLLVRHIWYRYNSSGLVSQGTVPLEVGRKEDLRKLGFEAEAKDMFSWRIWSGKKVHSKGWWRVDLVYATNKPVLCRIDGAVKPCTFEIEIR